MTSKTEKRENLQDLAYLSIAEAAELLGVHPNTIRNHIKDGSLKAGRAGQQWRIRREALESFLAPKN